jgi:hypothetical protein
MAGGETELSGFLEAAGRSLGEAQRELTGGGDAVSGVPMTIAISELELEVKATLEQTESGPLGLRPVSSSEAREAGISPEALSTVRVRYVPIVPPASPD